VIHFPLHEEQVSYSAFSVLVAIFIVYFTGNSSFFYLFFEKIVTGVMALSATKSFYDVTEIATRILPNVVVLTIDPDRSPPVGPFNWFLLLYSSDYIVMYPPLFFPLWKGRTSS